MFSHITIGSNDLDAAVVFYDAVLSTLGLFKAPLMEGGETVGWCWAVPAQPVPCFYVVKPYDEQPATTGNGSMVAFNANSSDAVDAAYAAGIQRGGQSEGEPGARVQYGPGYYGAYLRDLEGNKLHIVYRASL
jgi:catechol 2,3-dioxygenase-like lactoylglutathione lyase family enzyme